ncbi:CLL_HP2_G0040660.mRNA.1.CDS.1 [Saccharomyces cerevisiae]|nr:CLL_HP2_G0040660.mRNA.1.CDS.1 [Saccharomyces cerevisiae]CAI6637253.1 CLL_HP2_G0040660.mRNA.1.CDS.1 [Saccharomyces cerevisiae]
MENTVPLSENCSNLLLDEQSEPRRYYNPSNKKYSILKRPSTSIQCLATTNLWRKQSAVFIHNQYKYEVFKPRNITLDTLDSKGRSNIQIKPYQIFPSNNLVYEGLPHPAEQSLILSLDTSLIERAFRTDRHMQGNPFHLLNDCSTRNNNSAPQLTCQNHLNHAGYYLFVSLAQQQN